MFDLYLECRSLIAVVREVNRRGWTTKVWVSKDGREHHGKPFTKGALFRLLTNPIYTGNVNHKGKLYPGEHPAIIDAVVWKKVDERLRHNGMTGGKEVRNKYGALLRGLLHCDACGTAMVHTYTAKQSRRYRYYVCLTAQQRGWDACPTKSVAAQRIEDAIVDRVRCVGKDSRIAAETARKVQQQVESSSQELRAELKTAEKELSRFGRELAKVAAAPSGNGTRTDRMADLQDRIHSNTCRMAEIREELEALETEHVPVSDLQQSLQEFDPVWAALNTAEQTRIISALVERVGYDGRSGKVTVTFRSAGFKALCEMVEKNADQQ
jgi:site-specific DNA recombinase